MRIYTPEQLARKRVYDRARARRPDIKARKSNQHRAWRDRVGPEYLREKAQEWRDTSPIARVNKALRDSLPANKQRKRKNHISRYGLTLDEWEALFEHQGRRCASCGSADPRTKAGWHTDHIHGTLNVRGIVCLPCNHGASDDTAEGCYIVGRYREVGVARVAAFLEKYRATRA